MAIGQKLNDPDELRALAHDIEEENRKSRGDYDMSMPDKIWVDKIDGRILLAPQIQGMDIPYHNTEQMIEMLKGRKKDEGPAYKGTYHDKVRTKHHKIKGRNELIDEIVAELQE